MSLTKNISVDLSELVQLVNLIQTPLFAQAKLRLIALFNLLKNMFLLLVGQLNQGITGKIVINAEFILVSRNGSKGRSSGFILNSTL